MNGLVGTAASGSNFCVARDTVYVRVKDRCLRLDTATGKKLDEFVAPEQTEGKPGIWGYIACENGVLYGSVANEKHIVHYAYGSADMSKLLSESTCLFAMDVASGNLKWIYKAKD